MLTFGKKMNKRHAVYSVQSIQIKDEKKKMQNTSIRWSVSIFIYARKTHSFRSIRFVFFFFIVLANLNLNSARCQYRFGRDNRAFEVPRSPPRRMIYSNALVKCAIFLHDFFFRPHIDDRGSRFTAATHISHARTYI